MSATDPTHQPALERLAQAILAAYVRQTYGVTYKRGDRVTVNGKPGVVVSFPGQYLGVRFDGEQHTSRAHPTWRVERAS